MPRANRHSCTKRIEQALPSGEQQREGKWSESIAVGSRSFIETTIHKLGIKALGRKIFGNSEGFEIREGDVPYRVNFALENGGLSLKNAYFWKDTD